MVHLLDVNVLLALFDRRHIHHEPAHAWFGSVGRKNWATCPITENGFLRITAKPSYPERPGNLTTLAEWLRQFCGQPGHHFWADAKSILEIFIPETPLTPNQITDVYLLGLAAANDGKLATFDRKIPARAVAGGSQALELIG